MKNTYPFYIVFYVLKLKVHLINICIIEPPDLLFLVVFVSFYISRYMIHKFLELNSILSLTHFCHIFFFTDSLKPTKKDINHKIKSAFFIQTNYIQQSNFKKTVQLELTKTTGTS